MEMRWVFLPLFVEVALTFVLLLWMGFARTRDLQSREVHARDIALREPNWRKRTMQIANAFHNQLELPVLFYILTILAWITHHADYLFVIMAWVFVFLRLVHATIHVTHNDVRMRGAVFGMSGIVLIAMWTIFAVRIMLGMP